MQSARIRRQVMGRVTARRPVVRITEHGTTRRPVSLAVDLALESGTTLVGFLRGESMSVYAGAQRVKTGA
ncbi:formate dehydrogenase accessory protein [Rhodococcus wratislaviensis IFP 2016]|nr:formate dehydrogenase accessory protein [Rhodococcus wratislaviensis IFP 2016]